MTAANFLNTCLMDAQSYGTAVTKLAEATDEQEAQWRAMQRKHVDDVRRFQDAMQASDVVFKGPQDHVMLLLT